MPSRILPLEEIEQLGTKFWLPAGGHDNGVDATQWTIIAELEHDEVPETLSQLAAADVGGYAAAIAGLASRGAARHRLYVDALRYNEALDVLMVAMRGKANRDLGGYVPTRRASASAAEVPARRPVVKIAVRVGQWLVGAAAAAALLAAAYQFFVERYGAVQPQQHHEQHAPAVPGPAAP